MGARVGCGKVHWIENDVDRVDDEDAATSTFILHLMELTSITDISQEDSAEDSKVLGNAVPQASLGSSSPFLDFGTSFQAFQGVISSSLCSRSPQRLSVRAC